MLLNTDTTFGVTGPAQRWVLTKRIREAYLFYYYFIHPFGFFSINKYSFLPIQFLFTFFLTLLQVWILLHPIAQPELVLAFLLTSLVILQLLLSGNSYLCLCFSSSLICITSVLERWRGWCLSQVFSVGVLNLFFFGGCFWAVECFFWVLF